MKRIKLLTSIFFTLLVVKSNANDSIKVFVMNGFVKHNLFFYPYTYPRGSNLIYQVETNKKEITHFYYILPKKKKDSPIQFFVYIKYKFFFGGRWVEVIAPPYKEEKKLVIFFSDIRKRKYCYDTVWTDEDDIMYFD